MPKRPKKRSHRSTASGEKRSVEVLTVGWSLMVVTTLVCTIVASGVDIACRWYYPDAVALGMFAALMWFAAAVIGMAAVVLTPVVVRSRRIPPPRSIVAAALVISLVPLAVMFYRIVYD